MGRQAKLRRKGEYWATDAGGKTTYFGKTNEVPYGDALKRFRSFLADRSLSKAPVSILTNGKTVRVLLEEFSEWMGSQRSERTLEERQRHLRRWCERFGDLPCNAIGASNLESFINDLLHRYPSDYVAKHVTSVKAMFNTAVKKGWLPPGFAPFRSVEPVKLLPIALTEDELLTDAEVKALFDYADADLSAYGTGRGARRRKPHEYRQGHANPWLGFRELLCCYHATGARTSELLDASVTDFQPRSRQIVLGSHKRAGTLKVPIPRAIALNDETFAIIQRRCENRPGCEPIFTHPRNGRQWGRHSIAERFCAIRERASVRRVITIYSFRHLWISEMLMAGVDVLLVARMAGTSVAMIERVYGHFRNQSYQEAQARLDRERAMRGL
jgi:integrase